MIDDLFADTVVISHHKKLFARSSIMKNPDTDPVANSRKKRLKHF